MKEVKRNPNRINGTLKELIAIGIGLGWIPSIILKLIGNTWDKIFLDSTLVRPGVDGTTLEYYGHNEHRRAICRSIVDGCAYPGEAWYDFNNFNEDGNPWCHIITETGAEHCSNCYLLVDL